MTKKRKFKKPSRKERQLRKRVKAIYNTLAKFGIRLSVQEIKDWIQRTPTCTYCGQPIKIKEYSVDHILPRSRGGPDTLDNLHLIDRSCNSMKGNLTDEEFRLLLEWLRDKPTIAKILKQRLKAAGFMYGGAA